MGADATIIFFGVRYSLDSSREDESGPYEVSKPVLQRAAEAVGLHHLLALDSDETLQLYIGRLLAVTSLERLAPEYADYKAIPMEEMQQINSETTEKLQAIGVAEKPALHIHFEVDM